MESLKTQTAIKIDFNNTVLNDIYDGRKITAYTWIYRWENENEFVLRESEDTLQKATEAIEFKKKEAHKYLKNICENRPYIIVYHKAGPSKLKNCSDVGHFHMITWHYAHPTSEHSFNTLKRTLSGRGEQPYVINCLKIYNPYGLAVYLEKEPEKRIVITVDHLNSGGMKKMLSGITGKKEKMTVSHTSDQKQIRCGDKNMILLSKL